MLLLSVIIGIACVIIGTLIAPFMTVLVSMCPNRVEICAVWILTMAVPFAFLVPWAYQCNQIVAYGVIV